MEDIFYFLEPPTIIPSKITEKSFVVKLEPPTKEIRLGNVNQFFCYNSILLPCPFKLILCMSDRFSVTTGRNVHSICIR